MEVSLGKVIFENWDLMRWVRRKFKLYNFDKLRFRERFLEILRGKRKILKGWNLELVIGFLVWFFYNFLFVL